MIERAEIFIRRLRRYLSRSQLHIKLLGLSKADSSIDQRGLVIIQIDALSKKELERALSAGRMPFLKNLIDAQGYVLQSHYSGMPCSTASVQAELFYGVKSGVPAFTFFDRKTERVFTMLNPEDALEIEKRLEKQGKSLLTGGSSYSNIYSGGAQEAHFCISNLGLGGLTKRRYPIGFVVLMTLHFYSLIRTGVLLIFEALLAVVDCMRGLFSGKNLWKELKFVPSRVAMCILLRELITIGAKIDVARGMPIIHLNFMGYHEQSHRRGSSSRFAHWTLRGIDDAVKRIWKAAHSSIMRDYDVWLYSDHGQVETIPYEKKFGKSIQQAIAEAFDSSLAFSERHHSSKSIGFLARLGLRRSRFFRKIFPFDSYDDLNKPVVRALGPAGHIYFREEIDSETKDRFVDSLLRDAHIPMVVLPNGERGVKVRTLQNQFDLPEQAHEVLDSTSPYFEEMTKDLIYACHQYNAGDVIICGHQSDIKEYYTFAMENGSHGGITREETEGFVLAPNEAALVDSEKGYARPIDVRTRALELLGQSIKGDQSETKDEIRAIRGSSSLHPSAAEHFPVSAADTLRIMTYNVHGCVGMDGRLSPRRIARVISQYEPDVVALQELDVGRERSGGHDQAMLIADNLNMDHHFHAAMQVAEERFGDAVLSTYPMRLIKKEKFLKKTRFSALEPRGALWVEIDLHGTFVQIINTHLGLHHKERLLHTEELLGENWLQHSQCKNPVILCGDFNALPGSKVVKALRGSLVSAVEKAGRKKHRSTWFGRFPVACIDYIFVRPDFEITRMEVGDSYLARTASDHRPLITEIKIRL